LYRKYTMATIPTGMSSSQDHLSGFINITTAVNVKIAADAPTKVVSGGKNGTLKRKLRSPPRKNANNIRLESGEILSSVFPKTYKKIMLPIKCTRFA